MNAADEALHDERLHAALVEWWHLEAVDLVGAPAAIVDDIRSLVAALDAAGYKIVRK